MSYEADERAAYAAWRAGQVGGGRIAMPTTLHQAISDYGTARAKLAIKARHGGLKETGEAQEDVAAAWRAVEEEYTLAAQGIKGGS